MDDFFNLGTVDDLMLDCMTKTYEFREVCNVLDRFNAIWEANDIELTEAVSDPKNQLHKVKGTVKANTWETTKGMASLYNQTTTAGGKIYKSAFDLVLASAKLAVKVMVWIVDKAIKVPQAITKVVTGVSNIPENIKAKIRGDIKLYITAKDVEVLYEGIFWNIERFISELEILLKGNMWSTFFHRRTVIGSIKEPNPDGTTNIRPLEIMIGKNDMQVCRNMDAAFKGIKIVSFEQTTIDMNDKRNIELYFGEAKSINIRVYDLATNIYKNESTTYYSALSKLSVRLNDHSELIKELQKDFGEKFADNKHDPRWDSLSQGARNRLQKTTADISKVIALIGNIQRYVLIDMKTIAECLNKIATTKANNIAIDPAAFKAATDDEARVKKENIPAAQKVD